MRIDLEALGRHYQEMHVDGGAITQVVLYPPWLALAVEAEGLKVPERERRASIIRNARLDPEWVTVERKTMSIAERALSSLIQT